MINKISVDVVMVSLTNSQRFYEMTCNAIASLRESEDDVDWNIMLIENNKEYRESKWKYPDYVKVCITDYALNYNKNLNEGIKWSHNDWLILANNDLKFQKNWFTEVRKAYNHFNGKVESFGVWNEATHNEWFTNRKPLYLGYETYHEVSGWCIVARRKVFDKINFGNVVNQRVSFWYSDNLYADLLQKHKILHVLVRDAKVDHLESTTLKTLKREEQEKLMQGQFKKYMFQ